MDGRALHFRLAGINNQNFIMRDDETGTWWQQVTGAAIAGPLAGRRLEMMPWDEVTFAVWKAEHPDTQVLMPVEERAERYAKPDWEEKIAAYPTPFPAGPDDALQPRDLVVGVEEGPDAKAYPWKVLAERKLILDSVGKRAVAIVLHPDGRSLRCFDRDAEEGPLELFLEVGEDRPLLIEGGAGSTWDFSGTAVSGPAAKPLERIACLKDFWFDWQAYHPKTGVFSP